MAESAADGENVDRRPMQLEGLRSAERIGHALRDARVQAGMAQQDVADASGVPRSTVSMIEKSARDVRLGTLMPILHSLGYEIAFVPAQSHRFPWEEA